MLPFLASESFIETFQHVNGLQVIEASLFRNAFYKLAWTFAATDKNLAFEFALELARTNHQILLTTSDSNYKVWVNIESEISLPDNPDTSLYPIDSKTKIMRFRDVLNKVTSHERLIASSVEC